MNELKTEYENIVELENSSIKQIERLGLQKEAQLTEILESVIADNQVKVKKQVEKLKKQSDPRKKDLLNRIYNESAKENENERWKMKELNKEYQELLTLLQKVKAYEKYLVTRLQKVEAERCVEQWTKHEPIMDIYGSGNKICAKCKTILPLDSLDHTYLNKKVKHDFIAYHNVVAADPF